MTFSIEFTRPDGPYYVPFNVGGFVFRRDIETGVALQLVCQLLEVCKVRVSLNADGRSWHADPSVELANVLRWAPELLMRIDRGKDVEMAFHEPGSLVVVLAGSHSSDSPSPESLFALVHVEPAALRTELLRVVGFVHAFLLEVAPHLLRSKVISMWHRECVRAGRGAR